MLVTTLNAACTLVGVLAGWYASRAALDRAMHVRIAEQTAKVRSALSSLNRLADLVVSDVRSHKRTIALISEELAHLDVQEAQATANVVTRLVNTNQEMEERLLSAETKLQQQTLELEAKSAEACTDGLTYLANRRAFNEELSRRFLEYQRMERPLSVIFVNVDHFKQFNDTYGHPVGDGVLRSVAGVLRQTVRGMDMVARYGGEEFGVILPNTPLVAAVAVAERARAAIERMEFRYDGCTYCITVSAGVAELRSSEQVALLLRRADEAMYASKASGRNCTHYHNGRQIVIATLGVPIEGQVNEAAPPARLVTDPPRSGAQTSSPCTADASQQDADAWIGTPVGFLRTIRSRLAEWKRGGGTLTVAVVHVAEQNDLLEQEFQACRIALDMVGKQLVAAVREMDTVGQWQERSFALLLPRMGRSDAPRVAQRLHDYIADCSVHWSDKKLSLCISIGFAEAHEGDDHVRLMDRAGQAMDAAREKGGDCSYLHNGHWAEELARPAGHNSITTP